MKTLLVVIFSALLFQSYSFSQQVYVIVTKAENNVYVGIDNPITIVSAKISSTKIFAETDNGKIIKADNFCDYTLRPSRLGVVTITVYKKTKTKSLAIANYQFKVVQFPSPIAFLGKYKSGDSVQFKYIDSIKGLRTELANLIICDVKFQIKAFTLIVFRGDSLVSYTKNETGFFSNDTKKILSQVKVGDRLMFVKIVCDGPDGLNREIEDIHLFVKD